MNQHTPVAPGQPPRDPGICSSDLQPAQEIEVTINSTKSASASGFHHQTAAPNQHQLPASTTRQQHQISISFHFPTTRQQHQISISFQFPPPGSSTKPASASSFHHQTAAPNQHQLPASTTQAAAPNQHPLPVSTTRQQHQISQPPARHPANQLLTLLPYHTHIMAASSVVV